MIRGKNKLKELTHQITTVQATVTPLNEKSLYEKKVQCIVSRYYHFITNGIDGKKLTLDEILNRLSDEFFISTGRIANILQANESEIKRLRQQQPKPSIFKIKWAHLVW